MNTSIKGINSDYAKKYGFSVREKSVFKSERGLSRKTVKEISEMKGEPSWMARFRLNAFYAFLKKPLPSWGPDLSKIDFDDIYYYLKPTESQAKSWEDLPQEIKSTFDRLGVPEAERKFLAGVGAQYESETVYHSLRKDLEKKGVIFLSMDQALKEHGEIVRKYFGTVVPPADNKFAALNSAVWSGGSFVYIPKGVKVDVPLQAYFRINAANMGQFERTLIIAEEGSSVNYYEGCTAPIYSTDSLHAAVVEIIAKEKSRVRYTTVQNWSTNVYNLVTKRAHAFADSSVEWVDCNLGSKITMKYPAIFLKGERARGEVLSIAFAGKGQQQDAGAKIIHMASDTSSRITSKSISKDGGRTTYRGLLRTMKGCTNIRGHVTCDALILDGRSASDTIPYMEIAEKQVNIGHEASVGKIDEEQLFYLMSRGLKESEAMSMIVRGFIEPVSKELPAEFAVELHRLIELEMEGAVG